MFDYIESMHKVKRIVQIFSKHLRYSKKGTSVGTCSSVENPAHSCLCCHGFVSLSGTFLFVSFMTIFWTPGLGRKGRIKQGPSFRLSVSFLRIGSLVFSEIQHGVRRPYLVMCDGARFFGKNPHWAKMTENGQKWPKNMVFGLFRKITSLVLSGICVK